jgi:dolichyl-diphosphooligosaccharide--protein glycosyltransferase
MEELQKRKEDILIYLKKYQNWLVYIVLAAIIYFSYYIRTLNLPQLQDKYPLALDPYVFLRYATYIIEHGKLFALDLMRNYPLGFNTSIEVPLLPYFIAYLYKFLHFFNPSITIAKADILYPPIAFSIALIFFFLLVRRLFDWKIALLSSFVLSILPAFIYRTMSGFSDKEALAIMFMFIAYYFFVAGYQSKKPINNLIFGTAAGITTGLTGLVWGGVSFIFMILGIFAFVEILLNKFKKSDFYTYTTWVIFTILILVTSTRFTVGGFIISFTSSLMIISFFMGIIDYLLFKLDLLKIKEKIKEKYPIGITNFVISSLLIIIIISIIYGPHFFIEKISGMIDSLFYPLKTRWAQTVAESHEPFISDWFSNFSKNYVWLFIIASTLLIYNSIKELKRSNKIKISILYLAFIISFIFSKYSRDSILNGTTGISKFMYLGSVIIFFLGFIAYYIYSFYKDKDTFRQLLKIKKENILLISWFVVSIMAARRAIRLVMFIAPVTSILISYFFFNLVEKSKKLKKDLYRFILIGILILFYSSMIFGFAKTSLYQATYTGPSYNQQWQNAMNWVRENTPEEAVFAHWWDYGYWVQTGGNRATVTDGGNAIGYWNYLMGRHVLTGQSDLEALEFLYAHNVTHLLIISDEIGKYPAFSSIGSDENYDRYSWINTFMLDKKNIQETRNSTIYLYTGGTPLDDDFIYQDKLFPKNSAGIAGFFIPIENKEITENNQTRIIQGFKQPLAVLIYNGQQHRVPIECIYTGKEEINFPQPGLKGCLRIIPVFETNSQINPIGAVLYLSERVRKGRVGQLYLMNKESPYFNLVYNDENMMPLAIYQGKVIGPLKIWEVKYPPNIKFNETYLSRTYINEELRKI